MWSSLKVLYINPIVMTIKTPSDFTVNMALYKPLIIYYI